MTIPAVIATNLKNLKLGVKVGYPLARASSQSLGLLQASANTTTLQVTAALAADDALINAAALDAIIAGDLASGNLADVAVQLKKMTALIIEDYTLANLQGLTQRIQTNLLNVGA